MKKKILCLFISVSIVFLVSCGSSTNSRKKEEKVDKTEIKVKEISEEAFMSSLDNYLEKQSDLMLLQEEGAALTDAKELIDHAKKVVASKEFQEWKKESKKISALKVKESTNSEQFNKFIECFNIYNDVQLEYFEELSSATDEESYNSVNERLAEKISDTQTKFVEAMSELQ